jgi:leucyl aminopeptidase (aminopeptidase T)
MFMKMVIKAMAQKILTSSKQVDKFPEEILSRMKKIHSSVFTKTYEHYVGVAMIHQILATQQNAFIRRCLKVSVRLLEALPCEARQNSVKERELCSRYLYSILRSLFDDLHSETPVAFDFTDELNEECKSNSTLTHNRPDGHIYTCSQETKTLGYVEVKSKSAAANKYLINMDLARLVNFFKNALDVRQNCHSSYWDRYHLFIGATSRSIHLLYGSSRYHRLFNII